MSRQIGLSIRDLAVDLYNEHQMITQTRRLTELLREVFAELPEFAERLDDDAQTLDQIEQRKSSSANRSAWDPALSYRTEIGVVVKDVLSLSAEGAHWSGRTYPFDSITRIRWGGTSHSINGIPTGTTYTIAFGDSKAEAVVDTRREDVYNAFVERMWKVVGVRLLIAMLMDLKSGKERWVGNVLVRDEGVTLYRNKFWSREPVQVSWGDLWLHRAGGGLLIQSKSDRAVQSTLSYKDDANTHVLDRLLTAAMEKRGLRKLSELLS
jgi:hypothetical protein